MTSGRALGLVLFSAALSRSLAATFLPCPEDLNVDLNESECLHCAGISQDLQFEASAPHMLVDSDAPVILNRITQGTSSDFSFAVPFGISVIVKSDCSGENAMVIEPTASTDVVDIDGLAGAPRASPHATQALWGVLGASCPFWGISMRQLWVFCASSRASVLRAKHTRHILSQHARLMLPPRNCISNSNS